jgi:L-aminopeptidase/D-esterase-like protein
MAAIAVVNAFGDVFDCQSGEKIAGLMNDDRTGFSSSELEMYHNTPVNIYSMNTTLGVIITNGKFNQAEMNKIAGMTRAAYGRCINPVGTLADGDMIYAFSNGNLKADLNMSGTFAASIMEEAIREAVLFSKMTENEFLAKCI